MEREALKPVGGTREAFEKWAKTFPNYIDITRFENGYSDSDTNYAWIAWQAALAQPAQESAAWATKEDFYRELDRRVERMRKEMEIKTVTMRCKDFDVALPIIDTDFGHVLVGQVSTLPQRPWVGLTDGEIDAIYLQHHNQYDECESPNWGYERAIEAKLKEKNT